jgi:hypothetical protein
MATRTVRNVQAKPVSDRPLAIENGRLVAQGGRALVGAALRDRSALLDEIEAAVARQERRPTAEEIESWIQTGRA